MLGWADRHLQCLKTIQAAFLATQPYQLIKGYDESTREQLVYVRVVNPPPDDLVLQIGDTLHSMRVALDYLAFSIATRHAPTFAENTPRAIAFPICGNIADWPGFNGKLRQWASIESIRAFEALQPYHRRHAPKTEPLLVLDGLDNPHKHRRLLAAGSALTRNALHVVHDPYGSLDIRNLSTRNGPFENGAEVIRFRLSGPLDPDAHVEFRVDFGVAFAKKGPAAGAEVVGELERMRDHILDDVFPALEPFV